MTTAYINGFPQLRPVTGSTDAVLRLPGFAPKGEMTTPEAVYRLDRPAIEALAEEIRRYFRATGINPVDA